MRIFLTNETGYIGSVLKRRAIMQGHQMAEGLTGADVVIHTGWHGTRTGRNDVEMQQQNISEALRWFNRTAWANVPRWIGLGSQAEILPTTPYAAAKVAVREFSRVLGPIDGVQVTWARLFSVYGPSDPGPSLIHNAIEALLKSGTFTSETTCLQAWNLLFEDDAADAILALCAAPPGDYDVATETPVVLQDVLTCVRYQVNKPATVTFGDRLHPSMPQANLAPIFAATAWRPKVTLAEGLRRTVEAAR